MFILYNCCDCQRPQRHVHEFVGSVQLAEIEEDAHNHRFAGMTEQAEFIPGGHVHELYTKTDFYEDHFHYICIRTGPAIDVGEGRHVHFVTGVTNLEDGHRHEFLFSVLVENPIGD